MLRLYKTTLWEASNRFCTWSKAYGLIGNGIQGAFDGTKHLSKNFKTVDPQKRFCTQDRDTRHVRASTTIYTYGLKSCQRSQNDQIRAEKPLMPCNMESEGQPSTDETNVRAIKQHDNDKLRENASNKTLPCEKTNSDAA